MMGLYQRLKSKFFASAPSFGLERTPDDLFNSVSRKRTIDEVAASEAAGNERLAKQRRTVYFQSMAKTNPRNLTLHTPAKFGFVFPVTVNRTLSRENQEDITEPVDTLQRPIATRTSPGTASDSRVNVQGADYVKAVENVKFAKKGTPASSLRSAFDSTIPMPLSLDAHIRPSVRPQSEWDRLWYPIVPRYSRKASGRNCFAPSATSINRTHRRYLKPWRVSPYDNNLSSCRVPKRQTKDIRQMLSAKRDSEEDALETELESLRMTGKAEYQLTTGSLKPKEITLSDPHEQFRPAVFDTRKLNALLDKRHEAYQKRLKYMQERMINVNRRVSNKEEELRQKPQLPAIPADSEEVIDDIFNDEYDDDHTHAKGLLLEVKQRDLSLLNGLEWLNDTVINMYMALINDRAKQPGTTMPPVHCFNTHFLSKLQDKGFAGVKRWTRKFNLFEKNYVVVPVHLGNHWCAAVINVKEKRFEYYDSLGGRNTAVLKTLRDYLQEEHISKTGQPLDFSEWTDYTPGTMCPQQNNCSDCGVFLCQFSEYRSRGADLTFSQADMPYFRRRIVHEILQMKLMA